MKKILSVALAMVLVFCAIFVFASCDNGDGGGTKGAIPNGTYVCEEDSTAIIKINGNKMEMIVDQMGISVSMSFTYKVSDDQVTCTYKSWDLGDLPEEYQAYEEMLRETMEGYIDEMKDMFKEPLPIEIGDGYFEVEGIRYVKQ